MAKLWSHIILTAALPSFVFTHLLLWPPCMDDEDTILEPGFLLYNKMDRSSEAEVIFFVRDCRVRGLKPYDVQKHYISEATYLATGQFSKADVDVFIKTCSRFNIFKVHSDIGTNTDTVYDSMNDDKLTKPNDCDYNIRVKSYLNDMVGINLSHNQISLTDNRDLFACFEQLQSLNLSSNHIGNMHADIFKTMYHIKVLTLSHNRIKTVPETLFQDLRELEAIDLSYNLIEYMPAPAFHGTALVKLNLSNNKLKYLPSNFFLDKKSVGTSLKLFYFHCNPWYCGCLKDVLLELKELKVDYNSDNLDGFNSVCLFENSVTFGCNRPHVDLKTENESSQCFMFNNKALEA